MVDLSIVMLVYQRVSSWIGPNEKMLSPRHSLLLPACDPSQELVKAVITAQHMSDGMVGCGTYWYIYIYYVNIITKGSVSYLSSPCFSTSLGGIGGPARGIHGILAVMYWISIIRGGPPPPKMVMGSIPTGDAVTGPHIRGTLSMREMSL